MRDRRRGLSAFWMAGLLLATGGLARAQSPPSPPADPDAAPAPPPAPPLAPRADAAAPSPDAVQVPPPAPQPPTPDPPAPETAPRAAPSPLAGPGVDDPSRPPPHFHIAYWGVRLGALIPVKGKGVYRELDTGPTFGMVFGLNYGRYLALEMSLWGSMHRDPTGHADRLFPMGLVFVEADLRYNLAPAGGAVVPFLLAGIGLGALVDERVGIFDQDDVRRVAMGGDFRVAVGVDFRPSRRSLIGVRVGLDNLLLAAPEGGATVSCGDSYLLAVTTDIFLAVRF